MGGGRGEVSVQVGGVFLSGFLSVRMLVCFTTILKIFFAAFLCMCAVKALGISREERHYEPVYFSAPVFLHIFGNGSMLLSIALPIAGNSSLFLLRF